MTPPLTSTRRWLPAPHWGLLGVLVVTLLLALLVHGYTHEDVGRSSTPQAGTGQQAVIPGAGSVVYAAHGALTSRPLAPRTVALTFDDGPDPRWTPAVLDVLAAEHVPATFFVVGSRVVDHPALVRRIRREGSEIGVHTWTHARLTALPRWRQNLELSLTQLGLSGTTGVTSALVRPPYSSTTDALEGPDVTLLGRAARQGYLVVLSDRDGEDWRRPGVGRIVSTATAGVSGQGALVLLHDGGGNRSQTVAALPEIIRAYRAMGYAFTTVSGGLGLAPGAAEQRVTGLRRLQGVALVEVVRLADGLARLLGWLLVPLGALAVLRTLLLLGLARFHVGVAWRRMPEAWRLPPVSVLVPAYNEAVGIERAVRSLAESDYPKLEIVVIDDGSTDGTGDIVEGLGLPGVRVVRQDNAGKAVALTNGIGHASYDVLVMVDGDTVFQDDTVRWLVQPLGDPRVGAVSGNTKVGNRRRLLGRWQHLEYVVGFNLDRRMYDLLRCMPTVPGAVGAFRRAALTAVGGVSNDTLAEDTDLTMAVSRAGWRVVYEERAIAWTEAPSTLTALWRQRYRWCYGTLQSVWKHRGSLTQRGDGRYLGLIGLPYLIAFQVALPLLAPVIDVYALYGLLFLDASKVAFYWLGFLALQVVAAAYALRLDKESLRPLWSLPLQQFLYRQVMYLVVIQSAVSAVAGTHLPWHKLERTGDVTVPA